MPIKLVLAATAGFLVLAFAVAVVALFVSVTMIRIRSAATPRCPSCGIRDVRSSLPRGLLDAIFRLFSCAPYRCRACYTRFYRYQAVNANAAGA